jgi:branched-chain amino acid transport system substrate-binding protein
MYSNRIIVKYMIDDSQSGSSETNRRRFIKGATASGLALTTGLAGCSGDSGGGGSDDGTDDSGGEQTTNQADGDTNAGDNPISIGALFPLSGNLAQLGEESLRGVEIAVEERNSNGGVQGREIQLVSKDAPNADAGVSTIENLATVEDVPVTVGSYSSTISRAASQRAAGYDMPYWELGAVADEITEENPGNVFRTNPQASFFGVSGVRTARDVVAPALDKDPTDLNVAVMYESGAYGNSVAGTVKELSEEAGMNVVQDIEYDASTGDLSSTIQNLKSADVDLLNHTGYSSDIYLLWNQSESLGNYIPACIGNGGGYSLQSFVENIGTTSSLGVLNQDFTQYNTNPEYAPGITDFIAMYQEKYGDPPLSGHSLGNYFGMNVLLDTLESMDDPSGFSLSAMKDAALGIEREVGTSSPSWGVKFDSETFQNTRTRVTGHQWQEDTYTDDLWHPDREDGTADLYTLYPEEGQLSFAEVKNIPRPDYTQQE